MQMVKFRDLSPGQAFHWDDLGAGTEPASIKVAEFLYLDPVANGCQCPLHVPDGDRDVAVYIDLDADRLAS